MSDEMSLGDKAKSLGKVIVQSVVDPANALLPAEAVKARRAICEACPSGKRRGRRCSVCTCNIYVKTLMAAADCPLGHWPKNP